MGVNLIMASSGMLLGLICLTAPESGYFSEGELKIRLLGVCRLCVLK